MNLSEPAEPMMPFATARVLRVLSGSTRGFTMREIARLAGMPHTTVGGVVGRLAETGLVLTTRVGRAELCSLNRNHLATEAMLALVNLRTTINEAIKKEILSWPTQPLHASIFGSAARKDGSRRSDIDILVIRPGDASDDDWQSQLFNSGQTIYQMTGNHVSWFDISRDDLDAAQRANEPIVQSWKTDGVHLAGGPLTSLLANTALAQS